MVHYGRGKQSVKSLLKERDMPSATTERGNNFTIMDGSVLKCTQESLGRVIRKPPLTEKLLNKPPFRYLHDIFTEVIRTTGFLKGLYTSSELNSENVKDKDAKITFLQKAIDVVIMVSGDPLTVKPARVVAGLEPEKTNELLQALAKCCLNKLSSDDAVRRVLAGDKPDLKGKPPSTLKSQDKENKDSKEEDRNKNREKEGKRDSENRDRSVSKDRKDKQQAKESGKLTDKEKTSQRDHERSGKTRDRNRPERENEKSRDKDKERGKEHSREKQQGRVQDKEQDNRAKEKEKDRDKVKQRDRERDKNREKDRDREKEHVREREKQLEREKERERSNNREREHDREREKRPERDKMREHSRDQEKSKEVVREERKSKGTEESSLKKTDAAKIESKAGIDKEAESPARIPRPSSAKGQRRRLKPGLEADSDSDTGADTEVGQEVSEKPLELENGDISDELHPYVTQRKIPRPSSARPAPPRVKRQESTEIIPPERLGSGKQESRMIVEKKANSNEQDDDDEQFVVEEAAPVPPDMPDMETETSVMVNENEKHGGLVKKILKTKKDYETTHSLPVSKEQGKSSAVEITRNKEKDFVSKEIEKLRTSVQSLCSSAMPLGKLIDGILEDIDSMQNEIRMWCRENEELAGALLREQSITDSVLEPLKAELQELDQQIKDQQDKICAVKANELKNEEKIKKMIYSISASART
ncbi:TRAF3-interacting protein 1 [Protopterus annectens]|uniref:TRAF3-interacting protein 1 n=1 Tax=Protopterus annectens TaxID=7888 RepID=UPI001CFB033D|nr:TRAF3-interacting protein 1 [Protopterus annectens]